MTEFVEESVPDGLIDYKPRVLIVDDEEEIRDRLSVLVNRLGMEAHTAADGIEGCHTFRVVQPDIVILDVYMPRKNGFKVLQEIKLMDPTCPVILITGFLRYEQLIQSGGVNADAYLEKPFSTATMADLLRDLLDSRVVLA